MKLVNRSIDKHGAVCLALIEKTSFQLNCSHDRVMLHSVQKTAKICGTFTTSFRKGILSVLPLFGRMHLIILAYPTQRICFFRRVQTVSSTGSTESHRVRLQLTVQVSRVDFSSSTGSGAVGAQGPSEGDAGSSSPKTSLAALHILGRVIVDSPHVKMGAFHTLDIEANRDIRIEKADGWDSVALARVDEAIIPGRGAEVGAIVCAEGVAAFCLLSQHLTLVTHRISMSIPRKSASSDQHDKGLRKFYSTVYDSFVRHIPYANAGLRAVVIASPGWVRDAVYDFIFAEAVRLGDKVLQRTLKERCIKVHVNSAHVHSLVEVLKSPEVSSQLKETKFAREGMMLDRHVLTFPGRYLCLTSLILVFSRCLVQMK